MREGEALGLEPAKRIRHEPRMIFDPILAYEPRYRFEARVAKVRFPVPVMLRVGAWHPLERVEDVENGRVA